MAHPFEKNYFKKYLHENCHRNWFSRQADNARYKDKNGNIRDVEAYADEYTVRVRSILEDPHLSSENRTNRALTATGHGVATAFTVGGTVATALASGFFAPLVIGLGLATGGVGAYTETVLQIISDDGNSPEDVYFYITGDDSYWKAEQVPCGEIREIAYKVCKWSNEVYRERYIQRRSDNYEYQAQIEQRPPTPY